MPKLYRSQYKFSILFAVVLIALWLRIPGISQGLPYLYDEDEAHHHNRSVEMVKEGRYDPQYFLKPTLHLYLRMPVIAAAFLWEVKQNRARNLKDIVTKDPNGLGGYAFSVSHLAPVKWSRSLGLLFSLLAVIVTFFISSRLRLVPRSQIGLIAASLAAMLLANSAALVPGSSIIGVDIVVTLLAPLVTLLSLQAVQSEKNAYKQTTKYLLLSALFAGLTVATKYNSAPIVLVPLVAATFADWRRSIPRALQCSLASVAGFLIGCPFSVLRLPLFLDHVAYEIWHYGTAGHIGHTAEPGLTQAIFYFGWFSTEGLGYLPTVFGLMGALFIATSVLWSNARKEALIFLVFPVAYMVFMCLQRTNFPRNMLVMLPYICVAGALLVGKLAELIQVRWPDRWLNNYGRLTLSGRLGQFGLLGLFATALLWQPVQLSLAARRTLTSIPESRLDAQSWLQQHRTPADEVAIVGSLQPAISWRRQPGTTLISAQQLSESELWLAGFTKVIFPSTELNRVLPTKFIENPRSFPGNPTQNRVLRNPGLEILNLSLPAIFNLKTPDFLSKINILTMRGVSTNLYNCIPRASPDNHQQAPSPASNEQHCWLNQRLQFLKFSPIISGTDPIRITLEVMSPWPGQNVYLYEQGPTHLPIPHLLTTAGAWSLLRANLSLATLQSSEGLLVGLDQIHAPFDQGLNQDRRRLGLALKSVQVERK